MNFARCIENTGNPICRSFVVQESIQQFPCEFFGEDQRPSTFFTTREQCQNYRDPIDATTVSAVVTSANEDSGRVRPGACCFNGPQLEPRNQICEAICAPTKFYVNNIIRDCPLNMGFDLNNCRCDWAPRVQPSIACL